MKPDTEAAASDAAVFGAPPELVDALAEETPAEVFDVWPENERAVRLFLDLSTQWRMAMGGVSGLVYASAEAVMRMQGVKRAEQAALLDSLRVMEAAALRVMNAEKK